MERNPLRYHSAVAGYCPPIKQLEPTIERLRRRYGRGLNRRPSAAELESMWRAARLRVVADHAISDPACDSNTAVRLVNAADRAVKAMNALLDKPPPVAIESEHDAMARRLVEGTA